MSDSNPLQGSAQWLADRCGNLTASRAYDICSRGAKGQKLKAYADLLDTIIAERITGITQPSGGGPACDWGHEHEADARTEYEMRTGNTVTLTGYVPHPTIEHLGASPDGLVGEDGLVEIKCPYSSTVQINRVRSQEIPEAYKVQMIVQLLCTGRKWCDFVSYDPRIPPRFAKFGFWCTRYTPTETEINIVLGRCQEFLAEVDDALKGMIEDANDGAVKEAA